MLYFSEPRNRDARSALVDWEHEEHQVRMKTLALTFEAEQIRVKKSRLELEFIQEKHELEKQLLLAQIHNSANSTVFITEST